VRIWILNHYAVPLDGSGGTRHATLAKYLNEMGHEVTVFASATPHGHLRSIELRPGQLYADRIDEGVRFRFVHTIPYGNPIQRFFNMLSFRSNVCRAAVGLARPDVVIGSCVHLHAADAGLRLARRYGASFIFEVRDIWPESLVDVGALSHHHPIYWYLRRIEINLYRHADRVITLLPGMGTYLEAHGVPADRIWHLPNGIDPSLYPEMLPPPPPPPFVVSFFGAHGPANALDTLVDAAALLQSDPRGEGILFRLIGDGSSKPSLMQKADMLTLRNIEFIPPVSKRDLVPLAQASHAFIFHLHDMPVLERYGVSSNKLFDYLAAARPIIFACKSFNDPVEEAQAGLSIPPQDPAAMVQAVLQLRDLAPERREAMGQKGRAWVLTHHDMNRIAGKLDILLRSLSQSGSPSIGNAVSG